MSALSGGATGAPRAGGMSAHVVVAREHFAVDVALEVQPGETLSLIHI